MLDSSKMIGFVPTKDGNRARQFYESVLGLRCISQDKFAVVFDANGIMLRVTIVPEFTPTQFTVLGWEVADIQGVVTTLSEKEVAFERYRGMVQDDLGIWTTPTGAKVAWFKDPDGNLLSISQHN